MKWSTPEECFEAWKECTRGRPCDYTGLELRRSSAAAPASSGRATTRRPTGRERLYADLEFPTLPELCEDYGHDVVTGASFTEADFRALGADGRAILKAARVDDTARVGAEASTRSRSRPAAPSITSTPAQRPAAHPSCRRRPRTPWAELFPADAERLGIAEGDMVRVSSPRGTIVVPARVGGPREGVVFVPFHYGYWDVDEPAGPDGQPRAANELTITLWDPVSKQPRFKTAAVKVERA